MVLKRAEALEFISDRLAWIKVACEQRGWLKLFDEHVVAQHFLCRFLNAAFNLALVEMDRIQANFPAIDLGDSTNRIAYQITSERRGKKVQHTLDKFVKHGLDKRYDTLRLLIIGDRQGTYNSVVVPPSLQFDCNRDIMGIEELVKQIGNLDSTRLEMLQTILAEEVKHPVAGQNQIDDDTIKLEGRLTIDPGFVDTFGCPGIQFTLISRGKRPAKIRGAALCVEGGPFLPAFEKAFGRPLVSGSPPPGLEKQTLSLPLLPLFQPNSPDGMILQRDDACRFFVPMELPVLPPFLSSDAKDVSIRAKFFDESELPVIVGDEVQGTLQSLVKAYEKRPGKLVFPLIMEVNVRSTEIPDDTMRGTTNPHPFSFVENTDARSQEVARPIRLDLKLAIAQRGSAYTIGVRMKNISESPVQKVFVAFLAKVEDKPTIHSIPFAPSSEEALAAGQHRDSNFPFEALPALYKFVATLPTNQYGVAVELEDESLFFPGEAVKAALAHINLLSHATNAERQTAMD